MKLCSYFSFKEVDGVIMLTHCTHPDNPDNHEGNCTPDLCPRVKKGETVNPYDNWFKKEDNQ